MTIECPKCNKVNEVAGWYEEPPDGLHGTSDRRVTCGFCGHRFDPPKPRMIPTIMRARKMTAMFRVKEQKP